VSEELVDPVEVVWSADVLEVEDVDVLEVEEVVVVEVEDDVVEEDDSSPVSATSGPQARKEVARMQSVRIARIVDAW